MRFPVFRKVFFLGLNFDFERDNDRFLLRNFLCAQFLSFKKNYRCYCLQTVSADDDDTKMTITTITIHHTEPLL